MIHSEQANPTTLQLRALIVDDEAELRQSVAEVLKNSVPNVQFQIEEAESGLKAIQKVEAQDFDMVLMDVRMPEMDGLQALTQIKELDPRIFVVIMTAHANLNDAIAAIKDGAYDYLEKPVKSEKLVELVKKSLEAREMVSSLALSNPVFDDDVETEFVGNTKKMKDVFQLIYKLCKVDTTVMIRGENGTGKELVARAIHFNSPRKNGTFVAINCGAIPDNLIESELFGHERGAFTGAIERKIGKFQAANNGTLFLDEIAELKPEMQVKLLRVLQNKKFTPIGSNREMKVDTRIIAATNQNLEKMMEEGTFREDLFYRLNVMPIFLPPLRDRADDIEPLAQYFIKKFSKTFGRPLTGLSAEALKALRAYNWPGNIRELENMIERAFILEASSIIGITSLPPEVIEHRPETSTSMEYSGPLDYDAFKEEMEKEFIVNALKANRGRINQTVAQANIPKNTLLRKIRKYGINVKDYSGSSGSTES
jgi:two-component system response regulator AtoC